MWEKADPMSPSERQPGASNANGKIAATADAIKLVRAMVEERFLAMGRSLESAIEIHARLTTTFQDLLADFESDDLKRAGTDIADAAERVIALASSYRGERGALDEMSSAVAAIDKCILRMQAAVKTVDVLGISAKIEAVHLHEAGTDFLSFADEIDRSLKLAKANMDKLSTEISEVRALLKKASDGEHEFDREHGEALRLIPDRLKRSVESLAEHNRQARDATSAVAGLSQRISGKIGEAVMALQIGDITRQRIEHVEQALDFIEQDPDTDTRMPDSLKDDWLALTQSERDRITALVCRLQSAQLSGTAEDFDEEVRRIIASLKELERSAGDVVRLGEAAYGGSGGRDDTFLFDLESDIQHARALLSGFRAAREDADVVVAAVKGAANRLVDQIGIIQSLEADVRIVGLNTSFKCGRLGPAGRPLSIIAQELRACSKITATEAESVMIDLDRMMTSVGALSDQDQARRVADIGAIGNAMTSSVDRLGSAARNLSFALGTLNNDNDEVTKLLGDTIRRITLHEEIGATLRQAAADLTQRAEAADRMTGMTSPTDAATSVEKSLLEAITASYTMAQERKIHARITGDTDTSEPAASNPATTSPEAALEDFLF